MRHALARWLVVGTLLALAWSGDVVAEETAGAPQTGLAARYSDRLIGHRTASGERYDKNALTAAHQTLPFGTQVRVTNTKNDKSAVLRINDRGPKQAGRILDVSSRAAHDLGFRGLTDVKMEVVAQAPAPAK